MPLRRLPSGSGKRRVLALGTSPGSPNRLNLISASFLIPLPRLRGDPHRDADAEIDEAHCRGEREQLRAVRCSGSVTARSTASGCLDDPGNDVPVHGHDAKRAWARSSLRFLQPEPATLTSADAPATLRPPCYAREAILRWRAREHPISSGSAEHEPTQQGPAGAKLARDTRASFPPSRNAGPLATVPTSSDCRIPCRYPSSSTESPNPPNCPGFSAVRGHGRHSGTRPHPCSRARRDRARSVCRCVAQLAILCPRRGSTDGKSS